MVPDAFYPVSGQAGVSLPPSTLMGGFAAKGSADANFVAGRPGLRHRTGVFRQGFCRRILRCAAACRRRRRCRAPWPACPPCPSRCPECGRGSRRRGGRVVREASLPKSGAMYFGSIASTKSPVPGLSDPSEMDGASSDQLAPERPAASTSTISAMFAPRLPPKASSAPFMAAAGSVVGRPACVERPAGRNLAPLLRRLADADEGRRARRLVDDERRASLDRCGEGHRVGAIDRLGRAGARNQRRPVGRGEGDQPLAGQAAGEIAELAAGVGVALREDGDAEQSGRLGELRCRCGRSPYAPGRPWRPTRKASARAG